MALAADFDSNTWIKFYYVDGQKLRRRRCGKPLGLDFGIPGPRRTEQVRLRVVIIDGHTVSINDTQSTSKKHMHMHKSEHIKKLN
jgi:hypothetical protein